MPIEETQYPPAPAWTEQDVTADYLIFYSSRDEHGRLWCPDCVAVEGVIQETFGPDESPSAMIQYVGQRSDWKAPSNPFRAESWKLRAIPTVIRIRDGARLVDQQEILERLASFIRE